MTTPKKPSLEEIKKREPFSVRNEGFILLSASERDWLCAKVERLQYLYDNLLHKQAGTLSARNAVFEDFAIQHGYKPCLSSPQGDAYGVVIRACEAAEQQVEELGQLCFQLAEASNEALKSWDSWQVAVEKVIGRPINYGNYKDNSRS